MVLEQSGSSARRGAVRDGLGQYLLIVAALAVALLGLLWVMPLKSKDFRRQAVDLHSPFSDCFLSLLARLLSGC
jgi:hypothetical protein